MATELDLPKALAELITQLNNLRKLITIGGKQYKYDAKSNSYKGDGGKSFSVSQLKGKAREAFQTIKTAGKSTAKKLKIKDKKTFSRAPKKNLVQTPSPTWGVDQNKTKSTPKTTAKKTKTNKAKGVKQKTQYKTTGKPPVQIKPKKLLKQVTKFGKKALKKIRKVPGAGTVGRGVARGIGLAGGGAQLYGLGENLVDHARGVTNLVQRARKKPYKTFGATGNKKKLIELEDAKYRGDKLKVKKTNNKKTTPTATTSKKTTPTNTSPKANEIAKVKQNIKKAKGWNKRKLEREQAYLEKFGKQPRTWQKPDGQVSRKPSEGDFKSSSKSSGKKMHAIEKRNREIHGDDRIDAVKKYHAGWKKARKEGRLEEWKKKNKARASWQIGKR